MEYTVIKRFSDLQDGNWVYEAGDTYPRSGITVSAERVSELSGDKNRQKTPLIKAKEKKAKKTAKKG